MQYVIQLLETEWKSIDRSIRDNKLMLTDRRKATIQLSRLNELKRAISVLKRKEKSENRV